MMCLCMFSRSKYFSLGDRCELQEIGEVVDDKHECFILLRFLLHIFCLEMNINSYYGNTF